MKKTIIVAAGLFLLAGTASPLWAGGVVNKTNLSAEYIRTLNRNAATDSADAVAYNPAGVMKMANGSYFNISMQYLLKDYGSTTANNFDALGNGHFSSDEPSAIPSIFGIYKKDRWAAFASLTVPGGGGKVKFDQGNATTAIAAQQIKNHGLLAAGVLGIVSQRLEAESYYIGLTMGGAYAVNDKLSVAGGIRHVDATSELRGELNLNAVGGAAVVRQSIAEYEKTADGIGGIIGLNYAPNDQINLGLRYETRTKLDFTYNVKQDTGAQLLANDPKPIINGLKRREDLPALFGAGLSYRLSPTLKLETNLTYYFNQDATWTDANKDNASDGYDIGIALEHRYTDQLRGSFGIMHTETGIDAKDMTAENPELNANTIGAGFVYEPKPGLEFNLAAGKVFYENDSYVKTITGAFAGAITTMNIDYDKDIIFLALGMQYKF